MRNARYFAAARPFKASVCSAVSAAMVLEVMLSSPSCRTAAGRTRNSELVGDGSKNILFKNF